MYFEITGDDLFYKHRDGCGDISNHIQISGIEVDDIVDNGEGHPKIYICTVYMSWLDGGGVVYAYPDCELEDPDDYDSAMEWILDHVR